MLATQVRLKFEGYAQMTFRQAMQGFFSAFKQALLQRTGKESTA